jgi:hypothetical protein
MSRFMLPSRRATRLSTFLERDHLAGDLDHRAIGGTLTTITLPPRLSDMNAR